MRVGDVIEKGAEEIPPEVLRVRDRDDDTWKRGPDDGLWHWIDCADNCMTGRGDSELIARWAPLTVTKVREPEVKLLRWHYGPTSTDPDPGAMWCYSCRGRVDHFDGHAVCGGCGAQWCESPVDCGDAECAWRENAEPAESDGSAPNEAPSKPRVRWACGCDTLWHPLGGPCAAPAPTEPAYWWEWVGKIPGMAEPDYDLIDQRAAEFAKVLGDVVAVWEEQFDGGPGLVCSVKDAARVLAKYVTRPPFGSDRPSGERSPAGLAAPDRRILAYVYTAPDGSKTVFAPADITIVREGTDG